VDLLDIGSGRFTWRRLRAFLDGLMLVRDSAFRFSVDPDGCGWNVDTYLLATCADLLQAANWQRSEDGSKGKNKPKPIRRPSDLRAEKHKASAIERALEERKKRRRPPMRARE
jgi:hypothetical protein